MKDDDIRSKADTERWEEVFDADDRKLSKLQRKIATKQDRSKYKKTDRAKIGEGSGIHKNIKISESELLRGRVLSILSQGIIVDSEGRRWRCVLRGLLKKEKTHARNLVAVGDSVLFQPFGGDEGLIAHVEPRRSELVRSDSLQHRKRHIIAANIDQVIINVSVVDPVLKPSLVDRYVIATRKGHMDPVVVVNKIDLLAGATATERAEYDDFLQAYTAAGVKVLPVSVVSGEGLDALREAMKGKTSVFSGQSGVGKSSLINIITGLDLAVGATVAKTRKGAHTTTTAQLVPLDFGGWCVDTPGIRSFGVWELDKEDVQRAFAEINERRGDCAFLDCTHTHERDCAVKDAVDRGDIAIIRYQSYIDLLYAVDEQQRRR